MKTIIDNSFNLSQAITFTCEIINSTMQLFSSILALGALAPLVSAGCYGGGEKWGSSKDLALRIAKSACEEDRGELRKLYTWGNHPEAKTGTVKVTDNNRCVKLEVDYIWDPHTDDISKIIFMDNGLDDAGSVPKNECYDGLQKEINGCDRGGDSSYTHWKYK